MLSSELLAEVEKLAGVRPTKPSKQSGTRSKLASKARPKKALRLRGEIQGRADASKRNISSRQKNPSRKMYKSKSARVSRLKKKLSFQRKGEAATTRSDLMERMRTILQT